MNPAQLIIPPRGPGRDITRQALRNGTNGQHTIGSGEIAALLGVSPWESPWELWHRKTGGIGAKPINARMVWGVANEPLLIDYFRLRHPKLLVRPAGTYAHHNRPWQLATPDAVVRAKRRTNDRLCPLEVKLAGGTGGWGTEGDQTIPPYVHAQLLWQMDVLESPHGYVQAKLAEDDLRTYRIPYNPDDAAYIRERAREFLGTLTDPDYVPPLDWHVRTLRAVHELHDELDAVIVDVDPHVGAEYLQTRVWLAEAQTLADQAAAALILDMGTAKWARHEGQKIATRAVFEQRGATVRKLIAAKGLNGS